MHSKAVIGVVVGATLASVAVIAWPRSASTRSESQAQAGAEATPATPVRPAATLAPHMRTPAGVAARGLSEPLTDTRDRTATPDVASRSRAADQAEARQKHLEGLRLEALPDPSFWEVHEKGWKDALAHLDAGPLAGPRTERWLNANALAATIVLREAPAWDALDSLVDIFARLCSIAVLPSESPDLGHAVWRTRLKVVGYGYTYFEGALTSAVDAFRPDPRSGDFCEQLVRRVDDLHSNLDATQRADPAIRALVEFIRLNGAITYSEATHRFGSRDTAERLLARIRTFIETDRGNAADRVRPIVEWMRAWYPTARSAAVEDPRESTPLPPLGTTPAYNDHFARR